jgi:hypothetical protein
MDSQDKLTEKLIADAIEVLSLTKALEVNHILGVLESWVKTTSSEIHLLKSQVEYTIKLVDDTNAKSSSTK